MKNWINSMFLMLCSMMMVISFTACGGDDGGDVNGSSSGGNSSTSSGVTGWYIRQDLKGFSLDLYSDTYNYKINSQGEVIGVGYAWPFEGDESSMSSGNGFNPEVYYIPNDDTFIKYETTLYAENASAANGKEMLYRFKYGNLGTLAYYATESSYYTYWQDGNKLYTTEDGWTVYTITSTGIVPDGSSFIFSKYNPSTIY